jgi:hypothetical protein
MSPDQLLTLAAGAFFGALGWLAVGLYIQRRQYDRLARNAARAVFIELRVNRTVVGVALDHGTYGDLSKSAFDRLLPELATMLSATDLDALARAYMAHAGYDQARRDERLPDAVRAALLRRVLDEHASASAVVAARGFSRAERARLGETETAVARGAPAALASLGRRDG